MIVRATIEADFPAIATLTNSFIRSTAIHFGYTEVTARELIEAWRSTCATYPWLTAEVGGAFAGYAKASVWRTREAYRWTAESGIYVEEPCRTRGVGRALYGALIDELRGRGFHSVIGGVTLPNPASVRLHESVGFEFVGRVREAGHKLGGWHDVGFWQLMLRGAEHFPKAMPV